jgi:hypothetical protein
MEITSYKQSSQIVPQDEQNTGFFRPVYLYTTCFKGTTGIFECIFFKTRHIDELDMSKTSFNF